MNAPETRADLAKCQTEIAAGALAKAYAEDLLKGNAVIYLKGVKDYYSRQIACVELTDGRSFADVMIASGHAAKGSKGGNWCP
jgi:endonuclease YncB( thermonuclease family)